MHLHIGKNAKIVRLFFLNLIVKTLYFCGLNLKTEDNLEFYREGISFA